LAEGTTNRVSLTLDSEIASVQLVEDKALEYAQVAGFTPDVASHLAMVAGEAAANAVIHGNRYDRAKHVTATFELTASALTIKVSDQGQGVDVESIPDPLAPENLLRASGRGVFLMRSFMDEVHFRNLHPGTEISMVKHRT
jgi:serine/threonine-protein kinase RsbW